LKAVNTYISKFDQFLSVAKAQELGETATKTQEILVNKFREAFVTSDELKR